MILDNFEIHVGSFENILIFVGKKVNSSFFLEIALRNFGNLCKLDCRVMEICVHK